MGWLYTFLLLKSTGRELLPILPNPRESRDWSVCKRSQALSCVQPSILLPFFLVLLNDFPMASLVWANTTDEALLLELSKNPFHLTFCYI